MQSPAKAHKLCVPFKFWFQNYKRGQGSFQDSLVPVAVVSTVEEFWDYYQHFKRPSQLPDNSCLYLFQENIKPVWQDQLNMQGGSFALKFQRGKCSRLWEGILTKFIGASSSVLEDLNGVRMKIRKDCAEIDFWVRKVKDEDCVHSIREWILEVTGLSNDTPLYLLPFSKDE